jgi:hypothetical protein
MKIKDIDINRILPSVEREEIKYAFWDRHYYYIMPKKLRKEYLGETHFFKIEERNAEKKKQQKKIKKEIKKRLLECRTTEEEIIYIKHQIFAWKEIHKKWARLKKEWAEVEKEFFKDKQKEFSINQMAHNLSKEEIKNKLINYYTEKMREYFYEANHGQYFCRRMQDWLKEELKHRLWRVQDQLGIVKTKKQLVKSFENKVYDHIESIIAYGTTTRKTDKALKKEINKWIWNMAEQLEIEIKTKWINNIEDTDFYNLHPSLDKIHWRGLGGTPHDKGLTELAYVLSKLQQIGLIDESESAINGIASNFFTITSTDEGEDGEINKNSFKATKGSVIAGPEDIASKEKFSSVLIAQIDRNDHEDLLTHCYKKEKLISVEDWIKESIKSIKLIEKGKTGALKKTDK